MFHIFKPKTIKDLTYFIKEIPNDIRSARRKYNLKKHPVTVYVVVGKEKFKIQDSGQGSYSSDLTLCKIKNKIYYLRKAVSNQGFSIGIRSLSLN